MMRLLLISAALLCFAACKRESRNIGESPNAPPSVAMVAPDSGIFTSSEPQPVRKDVVPVSAPADSTDIYGGNAFGASEGKRLFGWMNCSGCHSNGGGGIGPPLMDAEWKYGSAPSEIYQTIVSGRPNGMPAFGRRLNTQQTWQLVAYVRSLSAQTPKWARPGRDDHMAVKISEQQTPRARASPPHNPPLP